MSATNEGASEGAKIFAEGETLTLKDGTKVPIRYGYFELFKIEEKYGSIQVLNDGLREGFSGPFFSTLIPALAIGTGIPFEELCKKLDTRNTTEYVEVFGRSLQQAFPQAPQTEPTAQATETTESTGVATITSQPAATDVPTLNSVA